jgi:hypothetical protein
MKTKLAIIFGLTLMILFNTSCGDSAAAEKPQDNANNQKALEEIRKETKVKEAMITDANVLYVSVEDDGTKRDGYAMYLCEVLASHNATTKMVKVMKVNSINDPNATNAYGVQLGESMCK